MNRVTLHGYFRSSASYRVRVALKLKHLGYDQVPHHLRMGEQKSADYLRLNPQGFVPTLEINENVLTQSLAICEYLDEVFPDPPLLPSDPLERARVRAFAQVIACDIHPIQNLKVLNRLRELGIDKDGVTSWAAQVIEEGFDACSALLAEQVGPFCFGASPGLADLCLVPQLANARRFGVSLRWSRLLDVERKCLELPAFRDAAPENQPDAEA